MSLVAALALVVAAWAVALLALVGVGSLARADGLEKDGAVATAALGFAWTIAGLALWNLWLPVDGRATLLAVVLGAVGLGRARKGWREQLRRARESPGIVVALAIVAVWLAGRALGPDGNGDDGLYHLQAVRWAASHPLVPGLSNLAPMHPNQLFGPLAALFDAGPFAHRSAHVVNGLFVLGLFAPALEGLARLGRAREATPATAAAAMLLAPAIDLALGRDLASVTPDLAVAAVGAFLFLRLVAFLSGEARPETFVDLVALAAAAVLVKLSAAPLAAAVTVVAAIALRRRLSRKALGRAGLVAVAFLGLWMTWGVVSTGYPLWPSTFGGWPVDWRPPLGRARLEVAYLRELACGPGGGLGWLPHCLEPLLLDNRRVVVPVLLAVALVIAALLLSRGKPAGERRSARWLLLAAAPALATAGWLATLPDLRYAGALFWLWPAVAAAAGVSSLRTTGRVALCRTIAVASLACAAFPFTRAPSRSWPLARSLEVAPSPPTEPFRTRSGLLVRVPPAGACWDAAPPCTITPRPELEERESGNTDAGYRIRQ